MLDLSSIQTVAQRTVDITHPITGESTGATITIAGPEHPARKRFLFDQGRRNRAAAQRKRGPEFDEAAQEEQLADMIAACTLGWDGLEQDGAPLPFSTDAARELYTTPALSWLRAQVLAAMTDAEGFIQASANS